MRYLDLTLSTPQHNLACDEALTHWCEEGHDEEILRFWEPRQHFAVLGHSNKAGKEVDLTSCRSHNIPVFRRCSGGGAVLQGPGCLNYSLILQIKNGGPLKSITETNAWLLQGLKRALEPVIGSEIEIQGSSDLALKGRKFSGNAQYRKRRFLLFHGTVLLALDIPLVEKLLPLPSRQPSYRQNRSHRSFLTNLNLPASAVKEALRQAWRASDDLTEIPRDSIEKLVSERYATDAWNFKF